MGDGPVAGRLIGGHLEKRVKSCVLLWRLLPKSGAGAPPSDPSNHRPPIVTLSPDRFRAFSEHSQMSGVPSPNKQPKPVQHPI